jgi:hypothetical protein
MPGSHNSSLYPECLTSDRLCKGRLRRDSVMASPPLTHPIDSTGASFIGKLGSSDRATVGHRSASVGKRC